MAKFTCVEPIEHDARRYAVDSEISLSDEAAVPLLAIGHIVARVVKAAAPPEVQKPTRGGTKASPAPAAGTAEG